MNTINSGAHAEGQKHSIPIATPASFVEWPLEDVTQSVPARFEKMVALYPQRNAIKMGDRDINYETLNESANRIAHHILAKLGEGPEPVGLLLDLSIQLIIAMLAVLKAGKFYIPFDPAYPASRIEAMLSDADTRMVLTDNQYLRQVSDLAQDGLHLVDLDLIDAHEGDYNPKVVIHPDTYFNLIYTSGSTGKPKGVLQTHRNVLFDTRSTTHILKLCREDRFGLIVPATFGASVSDIFGPLLNGGAVLPFDIKKDGLQQMAAWFKREGITVTHAVPTVFRQWMAITPPGEIYPDMRVVKVGGEPLLKHDFEQFKRHFPKDSILRNALGTTETYMVAYYMLTPESEVNAPVIPVGYPTPGREILILDEIGQTLEMGEVGQIAIKSRYLSPGYWRQTELTSAVYLENPEGGEERIYLSGDLGRFDPAGYLEHLGRIDEMVKIRGQRVELGEVETVLLELESIREVVVVPQKGPSGENRLIAYVVPAVNPAPTVSSLRKTLAAKLPDHMIPASYVFMDRFPLLPFGKVNRRALPPADNSRPELDTPYEPPNSATQERLVELFCQVLKLDQVGVKDNFFDLGGDSLLATQLTARIHTAFQIDIPVACVFDFPTVSGLADQVFQRQVNSLAADEIDQLLVELEELSEDEAQKILDEQGQ